jgi:3-O-methylgallate 3,4-dioxygenase
MADLVLALATSHSPMLNSGAEDYLAHGERDKANQGILDKDGRPVSYERLLATADPAIARELDPVIVSGRVERCRHGIGRLADLLGEADLDAVIVVGDDQHEQYLADNLPAISVYWGETIDNATLSLPADAPAYWRRARSQYHEADARRSYPVDAGLARHLIESLIDAEFDVSQSRSLPRDGGEGHAFGFVHRRLMGSRVVPIVPVALNTYFPPNQPRPARCVDLGIAIAEAARRWPARARIGIIASGGLSHFTIDEELDTGVLSAIGSRDLDALRSVPVAKLNSGNSEIRNWIAVAGAAQGLRPDWSDYVPCYRTAAGTGCGMAFAAWH